MREIIARVICGVTVCVVLALSWLFASRHNPPLPAPATEPADRAAAAGGFDGPVERGRSIYDENGCASCHAIAGRGNPRHPLDGVGARHSADELRQYVIAADLVAGALSSADVRRKAQYRELSEDEIAALIKYLASLSDGP